MDNDLLTAELDAKSGRLPADRIVDLIRELDEVRQDPDRIATLEANLKEAEEGASEGWRQHADAEARIDRLIDQVRAAGLEPAK